MSFAAVVGLVALVEANSRREHDGLEDVSFVWRGLRRLKAIVVADVMTTPSPPPPSRPSPSIIPSPSHYGVVRQSHLPAAGRPLDHAVALLGLIAMPLRARVLAAADHGLRHRPSRCRRQMGGVLARRRLRSAVDLGRSASAPGARRVVALPGQTRWRALGLVIAAIGLLVSGEGTGQTCYLREGRNVALRTETARSLCRRQRGRITASTIGCLPTAKRRRGRKLPRRAHFARPARLHRQGEGKTVAVVRHPAALEEDCRIADIVIAPFSVGKGCETAARVVIDRARAASRGRHRSIIEGLSIRSEALPRRVGGGPGCQTTNRQAGPAVRTSLCPRSGRI